MAWNTCTVYKSLLQVRLNISIEPLLTPWQNQPSTTMYNLKPQLFAVPTNHWQQQPPPFVNPFMHWQQLLSLQSQANIMPWCEPEDFYGLSFCPVYPSQGMAQHWQHHDQHQQYQAQRPPSSGPSRTSKQHRRIHKAEALYTNHNKHELSGKVTENRSTGTDPGTAWISANDNSRVGKVWRTPSENPLIIDGWPQLNLGHDSHPWQHTFRFYHVDRPHDRIEKYVDFAILYWPFHHQLCRRCASDGWRSNACTINDIRDSVVTGSADNDNDNGDYKWTRTYVQSFV
jgi:hypothetical protein